MLDMRILLFSFTFVVRQIGYRRLRWELGNRGEVWGDDFFMRVARWDIFVSAGLSALLALMFGLVLYFIQKPKAHAEIHLSF